MFLTLNDEPQPYVLEFDRGNEPATIFYLIPQTAEQTQVYLAGVERERKRPMGDDTSRARRRVDIDRKYMLGVLVKVENARTEGDSIDDAVGLADVVNHLDHYQLQELIFAAQNTSRLAESAKNS